MTQKGDTLMHFPQIATNAFPAHPSEVHELALSATTRRVRDEAGRAVGQHPIVLPGSATERDALAQIDAARYEEREG